ncbi:tubulin-specific chaperone Rbl2, putative [Talaromyces stipitatus ATCC 10500]|uniref:Tubulin-specific chaperone A n=1 Tax=Talaromyces stipitatus (strain ATCC 10500 / CBS 375.48 / QM 6759 / NRRL 1006) TaxID=441959 RepID=B8M1E9_TALSN|nr:tubulin-specific chaperone Rbl2, putative [Talaromyces stipitatus ATCC 10500]EED21845.1 tubulin-specific chaperone Rbl2, putative [Talaromyces stipitatus ATCC 10500]
MPPASPLAIATSSLQRLVKEEASYHRELEQQTQRLQKLESVDLSNDDEGNHAFLLKQERQAVEETKAVLPTLKQKISDAVAKLEQLIVEEGNKGDNSNVEQLTAAKEAISSAKTAMREIS